MKKLCTLSLLFYSSLLLALSPTRSFQPEEGSVTNFRYHSFRPLLAPLGSVMPEQHHEEEPLFGMELTLFSGQQFQKTLISNRYLDAYLEVVRSHSPDSQRKELSQPTRELLREIQSNPDFEKQVLQALKKLKKEDPSHYQELKQNFVHFYRSLARRGHHVSQVTRFKAQPEKSTQAMVERGSVFAGVNEVFSLHPSIPVTLKVSSDLPLVSQDSFLVRDDHHVYTFAGDVKELLGNLKNVSPETFWEPADESLITDASAPFVTAVEKNEEGSSLTPFIHLHPAKNKETLDIVLGRKPFDPSDPHQISVGLKDTVAFPDKSLEALGQVQHTGLEVKTGSLGEVMKKLRSQGLPFIERPESGSGYYENITKNLYLMFLPALLSRLAPSSDLDPILAVLSTYGFYVKTVPVKEGEKQPLLSTLEKMRTDLLPEKQRELDLLLEKLLQFIDFFQNYEGPFHESHKTSLATALASLLERPTKKDQPEQKTIKEFETIFAEILPRIREAKKAGYFMEFVLKWDPEHRRMSGGLLSQIFTLPLASVMTGRFTQWVELIERACFRETTLEKGGERGCSQFGGGSFSLSGTVNNFKQLIRGVTKAVAQTKAYPQLQLLTVEELQENPLAFLEKMRIPAQEFSRALLALPLGVRLNPTEKRLLDFTEDLVSEAFQN